MSDTRKLIDILDEEFGFLLRGDYAALPGLADRKERLEERFRDAPPDDRDALKALAEAAERNAGLIDAARRGLEQARVQIREIRTGMTQATYGKSGVRRPLSRRPNRIEQKL